MLGQLVCVDRRYQRMNCFNIREVQSLLKRKFFHDLVISADYHTLLNNTIINLRYKTNNLSVLDSNSYLLNTTGVGCMPGTRFMDFYSFNNTTNKSVIADSYNSSYLVKLLDTNIFFGISSYCQNTFSTLIFHTTETALPSVISLMSSVYAYYVIIF